MHTLNAHQQRYLRNAFALLSRAINQDADDVSDIDIDSGKVGLLPPNSNDADNMPALAAAEITVVQPAAAVPKPAPIPAPAAAAPQPTPAPAAPAPQPIPTPAAPTSTAGVTAQAFFNALPWRKDAAGAPATAAPAPAVSAHASPPASVTAQTFFGALPWRQSAVGRPVDDAFLQQELEKISAASNPETARGVDILALGAQQAINASRQTASSADATSVDIGSAAQASAAAIQTRDYFAALPWAGRGANAA